MFKKKPLYSFRTELLVTKMTSHSTAKGHGGRAVMGFIDKFYEHTPGFQVWGYETKGLQK
jgi:hypothetical protein